MSQFLYTQIAEKLAEKIRNQVYVQGDKIPSVRAFAKQQGVSVSTAVLAYQQLEDRELIEVRPKSGYYVKHSANHDIEIPVMKQKTGKPKSVTTSELVMDVMSESSSGEYISLGAAIPSSEFPIINQLKKQFAQIIRTQPFLGLGYESTKGSSILRKQLARRASDAGVSVLPEEIVVTAGCQAAINLGLRSLCKEGDVVAVETPSYYGLLQLIEASGLKAIEIPSDTNKGMSVDALKLALEQWPIKMVLCVPSYSNPLGALMPDESKKALVDLLYEYDIPMIEDDIYGDLGYGEQRPKAIKHFDPKGHVLLCSSVSKVLEPQLGLGWIMPGKYLKQIEYERFLSSSSQFRLPQIAVAEILSKGSFDRHLRLARDVYRQRRDRLVDLVSMFFPEETRMTKPEGGFVAWIQLPKQVDATELYMRAKEKGIIIAPGELFSSNPHKYRQYIRLTYSEEWTNERERAVQTLGELIHSMSS